MKIDPDFFLLIDPRTKERSVSFTMVIITFVALMIAQGLFIFGKVNNTAQLLEIFISTASLYFGCHISYKGNTYSADKAQQIIEKVETVENEISSKK